MQRKDSRRSDQETRRGCEQCSEVHGVKWTGRECSKNGIHANKDIRNKNIKNTADML